MYTVSFIYIYVICNANSLKPCRLVSIVKETVEFTNQMKCRGSTTFLDIISAGKIMSLHIKTS